jgi:starch synthase
VNVAILGIKSLPATGGADRVVEKLLENVSPEHEYWVYIRKDTPGALHCAGNVHTVHVPALTGKHLGSFSYFFLCCVHYLLKGRYDLAHVHNSDFGLFVPLLRLKPGVPVLGTFHGDPYTRRKWGGLARAYLRLSERVFVTFCHRLTSVSRFKDSAAGLFGRRPVAYIPNGVDPYWSETESAGFDYASYGLAPGRYVLFACGRLDSTKGLHHLLDAYLARSWEEKLLVVGDLSHDPRYTAQIDARVRDRTDVVIHRRLLPREMLLDVVRHAKVFVFPSEVEAMSMMLLEAISCRTVVVCSDIPENVEVVGADYRYLYPTHDGDALRRRLEAALDDPAAESLTGQLYESCMRRFGWGSIAQAYEDAYQALAARPAARAPL